MKGMTTTRKLMTDNTMGVPGKGGSKRKSLQNQGFGKPTGDETTQAAKAKKARKA